MGRGGSGKGDIGGRGQGGPNSQQAHDVVTKGRCDVTTSHRRLFDVMCSQDF